MKYLVAVLLSCSFMMPVWCQPAKKVCECKDCKCTPESHCGCMANDQPQSQAKKEEQKKRESTKK